MNKDGKIDPVGTLAEIRAKRIMAALSQRQMAGALGMTITGYHKIENGHTRLTLERLNQMARVLNESPLKLMRFEPERNSR